MTSTAHVPTHKAFALKSFRLTPRRIFELGGIIASVVLLTFGIVSIVMGTNGTSTVSSSLKAEHIVGTPDMTPAAITAGARKAGLNISQLAINSGDRARVMVQYMRIHTLEATGGFTYAQMGRYEAKPNTPTSQLAVGKGTDNPAYAVVDPKTKQPVENGARSIWPTETALTMALNTSYMAERLSYFGMMIGVALLLAGIGFSVLTIGGALRRK